MSSTELEQYTDSDRSDHEIALRAIERRLRHTDKDNRVSGRELAQGVPVSESTVRDLIKELRQDWHMPVYSFGSGYFVIRDVDEFERALSKINDEIATRQETRQQLTAAFNKGLHG